jgi:tetratricopeptide (TPR) repeat protein
MRAYVFTDASLARYAGRFVWLSVDIDDPKSAGFVSKYKSPGIPTFFVIDPKGESVSTRYVGGFTVASLKKFLDGHGAVTKTPGEEALTRADQLASQNKHAEALAAYEEALKALPKKSLRANRAAEGLVMSLQMTDNSERCATQGLELARSLSGTVSGANIASMALDCASGLKPEQRNAETFAALEKIVGDAVASKTLDLSGDDRSGYYIVLIGARDAVKDEAGAHKLREEWSAFLDREAARAKTNEERAVYDPHRLVAYMELNQTAKAIPMLELTAKQFPNDYNPFSRLASAYRNMKMWNEAVFYGRKAVAKSQGPRRLSIYIGLADAYLGNGDKATARATMQEAIAYAEALPEGQRSAGAIGNLKRKLEAIPQ